MNLFINLHKSRTTTKMATACGADEAAICQVTCVWHPNGSTDATDFYFCFNCCRVFCVECRALPIKSVNHQTHRTASLQQVLTQRKEQMVSIRKIIGDYVQKHDTMLAALNMLEAEQKTRINEMNRIIDDFASQLCNEVEIMKSEAKAAIAKRISEIWSANPAEICRQQINKELVTMRNVSAAVHSEVRLCERDERYFVEKYAGLESFANDLNEFQKKTFEMPDKSVYQLAEFRKGLQDHMSQMHRELKRTKDAFLNGLREPLPIAHADQLSFQLNNVLTVLPEKLVFVHDTDKSPIIDGVILAEENADAIYFVDKENSKIKLLHLKTSQLAEVNIINLLMLICC